MGLVRNVITQLHLQARVEEPTIRDRRGRVPDLDNVEGALRRQGHTRHHVILSREKLPRDTVHHTIQEHAVCVLRVDLLAPGATPVILGGVPEGSNSLFHEEEHPRRPGLGRDGLEDRPEGCDIGDVRDLDVALERVVRIGRIVIPENPGIHWNDTRLVWGCCNRVLTCR